MRKNSIKNRRVNDEVQRALSEILRSGIKDPRVAPFVSVAATEVAPDLKTCKVWVSVYGSEQEQKDTLAGLKSAAGYIRGELARTVNLRNTPELFFFVDNSIAYGVEMGKKIDEVTAKDELARAQRAETEPEEEEDGDDTAKGEE